jgi:hypothetical protein
MKTTDREIIKAFRQRYKKRPALARAAIETYKAFRREGYSISDSYTGTLESQLMAVEDVLWRDKEKGKP